MPMIYDQPTVGPGNIPGSIANVTMNAPGSGLGNIAQGNAPAAGAPLQQMAQLTGKAAEAAGRIQAEYDRLQDEADNAAAKQADNELADALRVINYDPEKGYLTTEKKAALDARPGAQKLIDEKIKQIESGLSSPLQKFMFKQAAQQRRLSAFTQMDSHAMGQVKAWHKEQAKKRKELARDGAVSSASTFADPNGAFTANARTMIGEMGAEAKMDGAKVPKDLYSATRKPLSETPEVYKPIVARAQEALGWLIGDAADALIKQGQPAAAVELLSNKHYKALHGELGDQPFQKYIKAKKAEGTGVENALVIFEEFMGPNPSPGAPIREFDMYRYIRSNPALIASPGTMKATEDALKDIIYKYSRQRTEVQTAAEGETWKGIAIGDFKNLTEAMASKQFQAMNDAQQAKFIVHFEKVAEAERQDEDGEARRILSKTGAEEALLFQMNEAQWNAEFIGDELTQIDFTDDVVWNRYRLMYGTDATRALRNESIRRKALAESEAETADQRKLARVRAKEELNSREPDTQVKFSTAMSRPEVLAGIDWNDPAVLAKFIKDYGQGGMEDLRKAGIEWRDPIKRHAAIFATHAEEFNYLNNSAVLATKSREEIASKRAYFFDKTDLLLEKWDEVSRNGVKGSAASNDAMIKKFGQDSKMIPYNGQPTEEQSRMFAKTSAEFSSRVKLEESTGKPVTPERARQIWGEITVETVNKRDPNVGYYVRGWFSGEDIPAVLAEDERPQAIRIQTTAGFVLPANIAPVQDRLISEMLVREGITPSPANKAQRWVDLGAPDGTAAGIDITATAARSARVKVEKFTTADGMPATRETDGDTVTVTWEDPMGNKRTQRFMGGILVYDDIKSPLMTPKKEAE